MQHLGDAFELRAGHAGDLLGLFRRPLHHFLLGVFETVDALLDVFLVFPAVLDDVVEDAPHQRDVGARAEADEFVGMRRGAREARIADDQLRLVQFLGAQDVLHGDRMRLGRIRAEQDHRLGIVHVVVGIGHRAIAPGIRDARDRGGMADARLVIAVVGAPERVELAEEISLLVVEFGRAEPVDRIGTRCLADLHHLVADFVDRLLPLHAGPLTVHQLERVFEPPFVVRVLAHRGALGAMRTVIERQVPARLLADPDAVLHFGDDGAADRAMRADGFDAGGAGRQRPGSGGIRFAHGADRQHAGQGRAPGEQTGSHQEFAAVERAAGGRRQRLRQTGGPGGSVGFFPEHLSLLECDPPGPALCARRREFGVSIRSGRACSR